MSDSAQLGFDGRAVANLVLDVCESRNVSLTNLALQKIVYFCHVWALLRLQRPLVAQEFEAWEYGPVLPYLYREFKRFDAEPIRTRATSLIPESGERRRSTYDAFDDESKRLVAEVTNFYARLSASELVKLSHVLGGPWHRVWNHGGQVNPGMRIDNNSIINFYSQAHPSINLQ